MNQEIKAILAAALFGSLATMADPPASESSMLPAPRYMVDVERYRFGNSMDVTNASFYPVPGDAVDRATYLRCIDDMNPAGIAMNANRGMDGPRAFMPVLVKYVQTGEPHWGEACVAMLKAFHTEMLKQVSERKWFWQFEHPAALIPLYRKFLIQGSSMNKDSNWFREMFLYYCRNLHVWDSEPVAWRGGCHRSMPEAYAKGRAADWYPDIPEAEEWKDYSDLVFNDFWRAKDVAQNDTGYMMGPIIILACGADQWTGDDRVFTDPGMKRLWDRLLMEISPDGFINPYGPNGGWNSTADYRIAMLERVSALTGDGRYRFGSHKLFNYLRYQSRDPDPQTHRLDEGSLWLISLAYLFADDTVQPVQPFHGSLWNRRGEAVRIPHTDKNLTERLMGGADPRPNQGHICCSWFMTNKEWPDKLILRSGWNPGDFFALVELHPTSFPANPGGIMGMNRYGTPFTQMVTSKGASVENRALVEDLDKKSVPRYHPDKLRIDEFWRAGRMPDIRSEVTYFKETPQATYARLRVRNMDGLPVVYEREFVFAKNRFLATREIVTFEESFHARVAPLWNTHNIGPQIGSHWANTFIHQPVAENNTRSARTPPVDLLVWFAPRADCRLETVDRLEEDPRAVACPNQLRYVWEGTPSIGQRLVFTQVYYPHAPTRPSPTSNNPNPGAKAAYENDLQATAHASGIQVTVDEWNITILRLELEKDRVEWIAFNPDRKPLNVGDSQSNEAMLYSQTLPISPEH